MEKLSAWSHLELWWWVTLSGILLAAGLAAFFFERAGVGLARRLAQISGHREKSAWVEAGKGPIRFLLGAALVSGGARLIALPPQIADGLDILIRSLVIVALAWLLVRLLLAGGDFVEARASRQGDGEAARALRTQVAFARRLLGAAIYGVSGALLLVQFPAVRNVGVSLLASAGIAGLVIGFAAQRSLGTLFAGIHLSLAQPIRIGDSLVVEGEFGTVEEIGLSSAVIKLWDGRRMVFPISYFLEKPFQNWSRGPPELLGTVILPCDFSTDVGAVREELSRLLQGEAKALWDGKSQEVKVTDATSSVMTLRVVVSAADAGKGFELRCLIRERLIAFLASRPQWLPRRRQVS